MLILKDQLLKKAKIISEYKHLTKQNKSVALQKLKKIKKQLKQEQKQTQKIGHTFFTQRATEQSYIEQLYFTTFSIMKAFDKQFGFVPEQKDIYTNFVQMNINFYIKQEAHRKAQEISRTYRKKLCEKNMLFPTLIGWFYQWAKKKFQTFIKNMIKAIERDLILDNQILPLAKKVTTQESLIKQQYFSELQINNYFKLRRLQISEKIDQITFRQVNQMFCSTKFLQKDKQFPQAKLLQNNDGLIQQISENQYLAYKSTAELLEEPNKYSVCLKNYSRVSIPNLQQQKSSIYINKEAFYGCFYDQFTKYYKKMNCIADIDHYYLKTFKKIKQNKKQMIQQRMSQMIQALMKNQSSANQSIKRYYEKYSSKFSSFKQKQSQKINQNKLQKQTNNIFTQKRSHINKRYSLAKTKFLKSEVSIGERISKSMMSENNEEIQFKNDANQEKQANVKRQQASKDQKFIQSIRLPIVTNPEDKNKHFQFGQDTKKQINKNMRGLVRYKFTNKNKQTEMQWEQNKFQTQKNKQFELKNIRQIMKERLLRNKNQSDLYCNSSLNIQTDSSQKVIGNKDQVKSSKNAKIYTRTKPLDINLRQMCVNIASIHEQMNSSYFSLKKTEKPKLLPQIQTKK